MKETNNDEYTQLLHSLETIIKCQESHFFRTSHLPLPLHGLYVYIFLNDEASAPVRNLNNFTSEMNNY